MPFSFRVLLEDQQVGTAVVQPAVVTRRLVAQGGAVEAGTPLMWIRLGASEYELRIRFRCHIALHVEAGQQLAAGALLVSGGADGEDLPDGFKYLSAHPL